MLGRKGQASLEERFIMGLDDKIKNKTEDMTGKAKEATGKATDDEQLEAEGKTDQSKSDIKQAGEKFKDAFGH
ncbi:hypothetical protein BH18ACT8_BH18ACT8_00350 [soil metagenome]